VDAPALALSIDEQHFVKAVAFLLNIFTFVNGLHKFGTSTESSEIAEQRS
jgi:hypothetical protein